MPTVIILDVSLSMLRLAAPTSFGSPQSAQPTQSEIPEADIRLRSLAIHGINLILEHFERHFKLEHVGLLIYSSLCEKLSGFTRDFQLLRNKVNAVENYDSTWIISAITGLCSLVQEEWGSSVSINVILVTDGTLGHGPTSLRTLLNGSNKSVFPQIPFRGNFHVMCVNTPESDTRLYYQRLIDELGFQGRCMQIDSEIPTIESVEAMFRSLLETQYKQFTGTLHLGSELQCPISLCPPPTPYNAVKDFEIVEGFVSEDLEILGFFSLADVASPPVVSRHLILPYVGSNSSASDPGEEFRNPSLVVFLHGALKVESMCALVRISPNWFGIIFSCADTKKKSSLMMSLFEPGKEPVPWLGDLTKLGPLADLNETNQDPFPVLRKGAKPSYSANPVVWIKHSSLQSDIQKILRHARKLPEKTAHFYKELNRLKRAALSLGFYELLEGVARIFDRECTVLPGSSHPDCAMQLSHAASELRTRECFNVDYQIAPLNTKFMNK